MNLESWLRSNNMETNKFAEMAKTTRKTLAKVKRGAPVSPQVARMIFYLTCGQVKPKERKAGRQKGTIMNKPTKEKNKLVKD